MSGDINTLQRLGKSFTNCRGQVQEAHRGFMEKQGAADGWSPLHLAAHYGQFEVVKFLVANGAELNSLSENRLGNTPLHAALAGGNQAIVDFLLANGSDPKLKDANGVDAYALAKENGLKITYLR